jgi:hypothetical protein
MRTFFLKYLACAVWPIVPSWNDCEQIITIFWDYEVVLLACSKILYYTKLWWWWWWRWWFYSFLLCLFVSLESEYLQCIARSLNTFQCSLLCKNVLPLPSTFHRIPLVSFYPTYLSIRTATYTCPSYHTHSLTPHPCHSGVHPPGSCGHYCCSGRVVPGAYFSPNSVYPDRSFTWRSPVPTGKWRKACCDSFLSCSFCPAVSTSACLRESGFKSRPGDRISWQIVHGFLRLSRQMLG